MMLPKAIFFAPRQREYYDVEKDKQNDFKLENRYFFLDMTRQIAHG